MITEKLRKNGYQRLLLSRFVLDLEWAAENAASYDRFELIEEKHVFKPKRLIEKKQPEKYSSRELSQTLGSLVALDIEDWIQRICGHSSRVESVELSVRRGSITITGVVLVALPMLVQLYCWMYPNQGPMIARRIESFFSGIGENGEARGAAVFYPARMHICFVIYMMLGTFIIGPLLIALFIRLLL